MAICPACHAQGELGQECPLDHRYFVELESLQKCPTDPMLGSLMGGQYIPLALIGEGGMGKIYRAKAKYTGKIVALKTLKAEYMEDETLKDRFFREAEVIAQLDHPNIVKLYACAPEPTFNTIFMAMELLSGRSLFDILKRTVPDFKMAMGWFVEIASALGQAHKHGVFHRDLKPENIMIEMTEDGQQHVKVLDFGFARLQGASKKLTMAGVAFGTPHYMSPEQAMGMTDISAAVDVYAVGVMLFQLVSGQVPYGAHSNSPMEVMRSQVYDPIPQCIPRREYNVPQALIELINKCMAKDPKDRYPDGSALCDALKQIMSNQGDPAKRDMKPMTPVDLRKPAPAPMPAPAARAQQPFASSPQNYGNMPAPRSSGLSKTNMLLIGILVALVIAVLAVMILILK